MLYLCCSFFFFICSSLSPSVVRLSGLVQVSELTLSSMCPPVAEVPQWLRNAKESTLTKTCCWRGPRKRPRCGVDTTAAAAAAVFQFRPNASESRALEPEMSLLSKSPNASSHWFVPFSLFFIDVCLVLQSNQKFGNAHSLQNILLYTVCSKLGMETWFFWGGGNDFSVIKNLRLLCCMKKIASQHNKYSLCVTIFITE